MVHHIQGTDCNIRVTGTQDLTTDCFNPKQSGRTLSMFACLMLLCIHDVGVTVTSPPAEEIT